MGVLKEVGVKVDWTKKKKRKYELCIKKKIKFTTECMERGLKEERNRAAWKWVKRIILHSTLHLMGNVK